MMSMKSHRLNYLNIMARKSHEEIICLFMSSHVWPLHLIGSKILGEGKILNFSVMLMWQDCWSVIHEMFMQLK